MTVENWHKWMLGAVVLPFILGAVVGTERTDPPPQQQRKPFEPEMVFIKGGTFQMGSPPGEKERDSDEGPVHEVTVSDFYLGKYEVTFAQYDAFCDATGAKKPNDEGWGRGKRPVINVSWNDADAYCAWLSKQTGKEYRLPTEAEWEYACRAGTSTLYSFGDSGSQLREYAWYISSTTHEVGGKKPNPWGLCDMHGNAWEWCADWYDKDYYKSSPGIDPKGRSLGEYRVVRGGGCYGTDNHCRSAFRFKMPPDNGGLNIGVRLLRTP